MYEKFKSGNQVEILWGLSGVIRSRGGRLRISPRESFGNGICGRKNQVSADPWRYFSFFPFPVRRPWRQVWQEKFSFLAGGILKMSCIILKEGNALLG
ncbi:hypothetical protein CEXT_46531 [Caerostris extrusa]|uniref:Uncharacterized protein n=1 Tax=Caerostris extrusa TaxID=172846 RepID=A0AAV4MPL6_CAEEX|nr:hypothetical protein CEXT_46531 [Caerostris extrusa]